MTEQASPSPAPEDGHRHRRRRRRSSSSGGGSAPTPLQWGLAIAFGAVVLVLPALHGGVTPAVITGAAGLLCVLALLLAPAPGRVGAAGLALLAVLAVTGLQLLPLPPALHGLSPAARDLFQAALQPLGLYPAPRPLSLDPAATGLALVTSAGGLAAFLAAWSLGEARRRRDLLVRAVGASGLLLAVLVLGQALLGVGPLLAPRWPVVNSNHLAGLTGLAAFVLLGVALDARGQARLLWLMAFVLTGAVPFLSLSRGGIAAFLGGAGLFVLLGALRRRPEEGAPRSRSGWIGLAGLGVLLGVAAYLALDPVLAELRTVIGARDEVKVALWRPAAQLARAYPLVGTGRGAFESVFPAYKIEPDAVTFTHLENEWLQPVVELGLPAGLLLVGALAATWLLAAWRRERSWQDVGLLAGTAMLAAHNLVDFSLEFLGAGVPFMVALGLAARGGGGLALPRKAIGGLAALVAVLGLFGAWTFAQRPAPDAPAVEQAAWRPGDWLPQATEGIRLVGEDRCAQAMPWLNRAMLLGPTEAAPHLYAARCLAASGQGALARREYRLALMFGWGAALQEAAGRYPGVAELRQVVPDTADGLFRLAAFLQAGGRPDEAAPIYRELVEEYLDERALLPLAWATWHSEEREAAAALAERRTVEAPADPEGWHAAAWMRLNLKQKDEAAALLERGLLRLPGSPRLLGLKAETALAAGHFGEARKLADQMTARTVHEQIARRHLVARAMAGQGRWLEAVQEVKSAAALLPDDPGLLVTLAAYQERAGRLDDAVASVEGAISRSKDPAPLKPRLEALQQARKAQHDRRMGESLLK